MKVLIETHGCKLNTADSQRLATEFVRSGYELVAKGGVPDVFVLNSCTVTHVADKKARQSLFARSSRRTAAAVAAARKRRRDGVRPAMRWASAVNSDRRRFSVSTSRTTDAGEFCFTAGRV